MSGTLNEQGQVLECDDGDDGSSYVTIDLLRVKSMDKPKEPTDEERGQQAAEKQRDILAKAAAERAKAKEAMLARNANRIKELGSKLNPGETLEDYDTRMAKEVK